MNTLVISQPHPDHFGGVQAWCNKMISFGDFTGDLSQITIYAPIQMTHPEGKIIYSREPTLVSSDRGVHSRFADEYQYVRMGESIQFP